jgi:ABC-type branched-subunit amino acid transport system substrate-binding protein
MKNIWPTCNAVSRGLLLALALLFAAGCASVDPVVKIGLVGPFEGRHRQIGYDAIYSARLAVREANAAGGIGGYRVALVALDDRGDPELAAQAAASLALDPAVVAVVGHYLPETTEAARPIYEEAGLPLIVTGAPPFAESDPEVLPAAFRNAYAGVTPFDETAGPFAGPTYDAFGLLWQALAKAEESEGEITRSSVQEALPGLEYKGVTGEVSLPE